MYKKKIISNWKLEITLEHFQFVSIKNKKKQIYKSGKMYSLKGKGTKS